MIPERRISEAELHAYVDGELTPEDRAEVEAMLAAAPAEAGLVRDFRELNEAIGQRYAGRLEEPVPGRMQQALARIPEHASAKRPGFARRWAPLAAAILIAAMAGAGGYFVRGLMIDTRRPEAAFVTTAIGAHSVYVPEVRHPVEVGAAEEAHLVQWLTKRIGAQRARARAVAVWAGSWWADACCPTAACRRPSSCTRTAPAGASRSTCARRPGSTTPHSSLPSATASARSTGSTGRSPMRSPAGSAARS